jgi:hypothetical protein
MAPPPASACGPTSPNFNPQDGSRSNYMDDSRGPREPFRQQIMDSLLIAVYSSSNLAGVFCSSDKTLGRDEIDCKQFIGMTDLR